MWMTRWENESFLTECLDHGRPSLLYEQHTVGYVSSLCPLRIAYNGHDVSGVDDYVSVAEA